MNEQEMNVLRQLVERHEFLREIDEASDENGLAILDRRAGACCVVDHPDALTDLVEMGVEWYLNSGHNIKGMPISR